MVTKLYSGKPMVVVALLAIILPWPRLVSCKVLRIIDFEAKCDGHTDDTKAIQATINAANSNDTIELPTGKVCIYSNVLIMREKSNVVMYGFGGDSSQLSAVNPMNSALWIDKSHNIVIRDLRINSPNSTSRTAHSEAIGVYVTNSFDIKVQKITVWKTSNAGILMENCTRVDIHENHILNTWSDGIHATHGCHNVTIEKNFASHTGDDSFATVGYEPTKNYYIRILDNQSEYSSASGVTVGGSEFVDVFRNRIYRSTVAGVRVESDHFWKTDGDRNVHVKENIITECPQNWTRGHAGIFVYSNYRDSSDIVIEGNTIISPPSPFAIGSEGRDGSVRNLQITNNTVTDKNNRVANINCIQLYGNVINVSISTNTLNTGICNYKKDAF
jgi:polygalacturonase